MEKIGKSPWFRLAMILGIIVLIIAGGALFGKLDTVLAVLGAIGLLLLGITVLVTIHELGHFLAAKAFGMRVETFSIGFPPTIFKWTKGETEYQIGATPLGGFVKISGIIDESLDTGHLANTPEPYEFRAKPVWQRIIVMVAGVVFNVILGVLIFSMVIWARGEKQLPVSELTYGIEVIESVTAKDKCDATVQKTTLGYLLGFRTGDQLLSFKGQPLKYFNEYSDPALLLEKDAWFEVLRNGEKVKIAIPGTILQSFSNDTVARALFSINNPSLVRVAEGLPAQKAGIQDGDRIIAIAGQPVKYFADLLNILPGRANQTVDVAVLRVTDTLKFAVTLDSASKMGVGVDPAFMKGMKQDTVNYNFFSAFGPGMREAFGILSLNVKGFERIAAGQADASKSLMGPVAIGKQFWDTFQEVGWLGVVMLTASLSMILAFVNILPIPALDGGHVVILLIEAVIRREISPKVRIIVQQIGMVLLLGLMVMVLFNDFITHIFTSCP